MFTEKNVRFLVNTYELPEKLSDRLTAIVWREAKERLFATNFDALYRRISELVEKFDCNYSEHRFLRLDSPIGQGERKQDFYSIIANPKSQEQADEKVYSCKVIPTMSIDDIVGLLSSRLDAVQIQVLRCIAAQVPQDKLLYLEPEEILRSVPQIALRLEEAVKHYERGGEIVMPRRSIVEIRWNPRFWVKYGRRKFNGNPAQFFRENIDVYGEMTRMELIAFDGSLYYALLRAGQLDNVIPNRYV